LATTPSLQPSPQLLHDCYPLSAIRCRIPGPRLPAAPGLSNSTTRLTPATAAGCRIPTPGGARRRTRLPAPSPEPPAFPKWKTIGPCKTMLHGPMSRAPSTRSKPDA
jgi:hypothetical protein